jgi:hypothetical protein
MDTINCPKCQNAFDLDDPTYKESGLCPHCNINVVEFRKKNIKKLKELIQNDELEKMHAEWDYYATYGNEDPLREIRSNTKIIYFVLKIFLICEGVLIFITTGYSIFEDIPRYELTVVLSEGEVCRHYRIEEHAKCLYLDYFSSSYANSEKDFLGIKTLKIFLQNTGKKPIPLTVIRIKDIQDVLKFSGEFYEMSTDNQIKITEFINQISQPIFHTKDYANSLGDDRPNLFHTDKFRKDDFIKSYAIKDMSNCGIEIIVPVFRYKDIKWDDILYKIDVSHGGTRIFHEKNIGDYANFFNARGVWAGFNKFNLINYFQDLLEDYFESDLDDKINKDVMDFKELLDNSGVEKGK